MNGATFYPGERVGGFAVVKPLGKGGMAELFLARDQVLRRRVVLKVLLPPLNREKGFKEQFLREARIQANLESPHIVQVLGVLEHRETLCLVMQYVQGTDLDKVVKKARLFRERKGRKGGLSLERAIHVFTQVLEGVGSAHKYRIIHGDIKPANILLDRQGRAKVSDFGLALLLTRDGRPIHGMPQGGTPAYMSPERILDQKVDFRSDIYSLGVTLFHMITGEFPMGDRRRAMEFVECHLEGSLEEARAILSRFEEVPHRIEKAILKALEPRPDDRHQSCLEFALAIREDASRDMYSELLRLALLSKKEITPTERAYLDEYAGRRSLTPEEASALEINIRMEMGLPALDFKREYRVALAHPVQKGKDVGAARAELERLYVGTKRITPEEAGRIAEDFRPGKGKH
ncbi:MAG: serine/threonine-protein kinase [Thermodesulfobacteriota bacterium]